ncbi:hypothetical protein [Corynebacterium urealyticum]|uniref:hypothetical protein n=1 Tax=Corynebacterium urealyticum TaxID=43771 RepID=UPI0011E88DFD|nr:hypothetical protein [Corynebacterium urealyticum]TYR16308.1 hypothetical protein FYJ89_07550 [Corynebacterium urealyticum]
MKQPHPTPRRESLRETSASNVAASSTSATNGAVSEGAASETTTSGTTTSRPVTASRKVTASRSSTTVRSGTASRPARPIYQSPIAVWIGWLLANIFQLSLVVTYRWGTEDLSYYRNGSLLSGPFGEHIVGIGGSPTPLSEYPDVGVWPILAVKAIADVVAPGSEKAFYLIFALACCLLGALFTGYLLRLGRFLGAWTWVGVSFAIGPILLTRLDLIPGLAVGVGVAVVVSHPRVAGALLAFATASKLWPGVLAVALVDRWNARGTWQRLGFFALTLAVLVGITIATQGFERVISPLTYQDVRGLQVESVAATPFTFLSAFDARWEINLSSSKSYEVTGPGVELAMHAATAVMALTLLLGVYIALRHFFRGGWNTERALAAATMLVALLLLGNKVFSPQYVLWLAPLICLAMPARIEQRGVRSEGARWRDVLLDTSKGAPLVLGVLTVIIAGLSFLVFPISYGWLVSSGPAGIPASILVVRNLLCILVAVIAVRWWLRVSRPGAQVV